MKKTLLILLPAGALAAGMGWYHQSRFDPLVKAPEVAVPPQGPPPTRTLTDQPAIFKKAFWREPAPGDQIIHAERQEWSDAGGITRWAWFIEVNGSPDLLKYLKEDNSFGLVRTPSAPWPEGRPAWFAFEPSEVSTLKSPRGNLQLIFSNHSNKLLACDSGRGFQRGAPAPVPATVCSTITRQNPVSGRLPVSSPPHPNP